MICCFVWCIGEIILVVGVHVIWLETFEVNHWGGERGLVYGCLE